MCLLIDFVEIGTRTVALVLEAEKSLRCFATTSVGHNRIGYIGRESLEWVSSDLNT